MELANETITAAQQIAACFRFRSWIRKRGTGDGIVRCDEVSMRMRGFNRCPIDDETKQQKRERARKQRAALG